jgi:hypothetical protein
MVAPANATTTRIRARLGHRPLAWVGARLIAFERVITGALPPPTAEQRDQLATFHVVAEGQECDCDFLLVCFS